MQYIYTTPSGRSKIYDVVKASADGLNVVSETGQEEFWSHGWVDKEKEKRNLSVVE